MAESPFNSLPIEVPTAIARLLEHGEKVLWAGGPDAARLRLKSIVLALLALLLSPIMFPWEEGSLLGLIIVGVLLYKAVQFYWRASTARNTFYALTDRRALIVAPGKEVEVIRPNEFLVGHRSFAHRGEVILMLETTEDSYTEIGFFSIENSHEVARLARELQQKASSNSADPHPLNGP